MTDEELIADLNRLFWLLKEDGHYTEANTASFAVIRLDAQAAEIERLRGERERLALAICGGEDAPGYANAQTIETLEKVARDNHNTTMEQIDRIKSQTAEIERLRGEVARAEAILEREIMRVKKIQTDLPPPHKVCLFSVQSEYELMLAELKGAKP